MKQSWIGMRCVRSGRCFNEGQQEQYGGYGIVGTGSSQFVSEQIVVVWTRM